MLVTNSYSSLSVNQGVQSSGNNNANSNTTLQPLNKVSEVDSSYQNYERDAVQRIQKETEEKELQQSSQSQTRFDVDEASLALAVSIADSTNIKSNVNFNANSNEVGNNPAKNTLGYDEPSSGNLTAVSAYQSIDNIAKRESVRDVFGVDLFA